MLSPLALSQFCTLKHLDYIYLKKNGGKKPNNQCYVVYCVTAWLSAHWFEAVAALEMWNWILFVCLCLLKLWDGGGQGGNYLSEAFQAL